MYNLLLDTDSYKASHWLQYPPGTDRMFSYIESRGGRYPATVFFGLQYILKNYLSQP
jgi:nicotinamide phosphoribosyltransferase